MLLKDLPFKISEGKILDPYASNGAWWKGLDISHVTFVDKFVARVPGTIQASVEALPFGDGVFDQIVADPPHFIRKSKFAPSCALSHFGSYPTRDAVRREWREAGREFRRVSKVRSELLLKTIDGAKTVNQCVNNEDLECFSECWKKMEEYRIRSRVPWSSAWTVFTLWRRID